MARCRNIQRVMSASDIAISVRGVGKAYTIRHAAAHAPTTLGEAIISRITRPLGRRTQKETFWALKDVSFDVKKGEVVGIIGRNGAGKSTLLKILSRITEMTEGEVDLFGRVGSLLEVGTGFHQELSGRENIFLNGAILGMTRAEIKKQFEAIVDFAGVEKFLDTPVKRYSSGMYVRLAFAVAAHLRSEILIVDEVLAVGDGEFQKKCLGKMKEVSTDGRTVLLVSHNTRSLVDLCSTCVFLSSGQLVGIGDVADVVSRYAMMSAAKDQRNAASRIRSRPGTGQYRFVRAEFSGDTFKSNEPKTLQFEIDHQWGSLGEFFIVVMLFDQFGNKVFHTDSTMRGVTCRDAKRVSGNFVFRSPWLTPGRYCATLQIGAGSLVDEFADHCFFDVLVGPYPVRYTPDASVLGPVSADFDVQTLNGAERVAWISQD